MMRALGKPFDASWQSKAYTLDLAELKIQKGLEQPDKDASENSSQLCQFA